MGVLLERDGELGALRDAIAGARDTGRCTAVLVEGRAGIGKTRLLAEIPGLAAEAGLDVCSAIGGELERQEPFGVARQLLAPILQRADPATRAALTDGEAAAAARALQPGGGDREALLTDALAGLEVLVARLARTCPTVLVVDDAHWADEPSARLLERLVRRGPAVPLSVVIAARPAEPESSDVLRRVLALPGPQRLRPEPLGAQATQRLVRDLLDDADPAFCRACHDVTGGNPFLVHETVRAARSGGLRPTAAGAQALRTLGPEGVARQVLARLDAAPPAVAALARVAAVLERGAPVRHAARLLECDLEAAEAAAAALVDLGILEDATALRFVHPVVRSAVRDHLPAPWRSTQHRRAAWILEDEGAEPEHAAVHLLASAPAGEARAVGLLCRAGRAARRRGAPDLAVDFLRRALEEPPPPDRRAEVLRDLATSARRLADPQAVEHLEASIAAEPDPRLARRDRRRLALWLYAAGRAVDALGVLDALVADEEADGALDHAAELQALALTAALYAGLGDPDDRIARLEALAAAGPVPVPVTAVLGYAAVVRGQPAAAAADLLSRAVRGFRTAEGGVLPPLWDETVAACILLDDAALTGSLLEEALAAAGRSASRAHRAKALSFAAWDSVRRGRLDAAVHQAASVVRDSETGTTVAHRDLAFRVLVEASLDRGDLDAANHWRAGFRRVPGPSSMGDMHLAYADAVLALARGELRHGLEVLREAGNHAQAVGRTNPSVLPWRSASAVALAACGRGDDARPLADEELHRARAFGTPRAVGIALRAAALAHDDPERAQDAVAILDRADAPVESARAHLALGSILRRRGDRRASRAPLRAALDLATRVGAREVARRAADELDASGARRRTDVLSGVEALTPAEVRVARLAAEGRTNREIATALFLTPKTIEKHLSSTYRKLDVTSRADLAEALPASTDAG